LNELAIAHYSRGNFEDALRIFNENLLIVKNIDNHKLIVTLLNNIGCTCFAQQNMNDSLDAFFEVLEIQRIYFIKYFGSPLKQVGNDVSNMKIALRAMEQTLHNLSYVHAFMEDNSTSSFFLDTALSINKTLIAASISNKVEEEESPSSILSETFEV
jgi:tetratricopeptide (TPR) repeat protein